MQQSSQPKHLHSDSATDFKLTIDAILEHTQTCQTSTTFATNSAIADCGDQTTEIWADGRQIVLSACNELVLRCGKASITLTSDGKLLLRGSYVRSHAEGVNRIQGGSVQIN